MTGRAPRRPPRATLAVLAITLATSGCATAPPPPAGRPIASASASSGWAEGYYAAAVRAIGTRDYPAALEALQAAHAASPRDPRVLNAFGVVYDKLGRFDLSARYYDAALGLDASSSVIGANMSYSRVLRRAAERARRCPGPPSGDPGAAPAQQDRRPPCEV